METRRIERCYKGVVCLRYASKMWVKPAEETRFQVGDRPYVCEGFAGKTVIVWRDDCREEWQELQGSKPHPRFCVCWSEVDRKYHGTCDRRPDLCFQDEDPQKALVGIMGLVG